MVEEARFTQSLDHRAIMARKGYRSLPVQFVKAKEVYDPSDFIRSLEERRNKASLKEMAIKDTNMEVIETRLNSIEVSKIAENLIQEVLSDNDSDFDVLEKDLGEATVPARNDILDDIDNDMDQISIDDFEPVDNDDDVLSVGDLSDDNQEHLDGQEELDALPDDDEESFLENSDAVFSDQDPLEESAELKSGKSTEPGSGSESESESDFDENDISAMAFLINRPMDGGDDIYIPPCAPTVKPNNFAFTLKNIKKIIQTDINSDEELEFTVQRINVDKSIVVDTVKYSQIAKENSHLKSVEQLNSTIKFLGGIVSSYDINDRGKKPPTEVAKMIDTLSNFQGKNNKRTRKAAKELAEIAAEVEPTFDASSRKKSKRTPSFSAADPSLRKQLTEAWRKARDSQASKKEEREELRKEGKLTKEYKVHGTIPLVSKYPTSMSIHDIVREIETFVNNTGKNSLPFPPMVKKHRAVISDLSKAYYLTTNSVGKGKDKQVVCSKTSKTVFAHRDVDLIDFITKSFSFKKFVVSTDPNQGDKENAKAQKRALRAVKGSSSRQFQEGEEVGANADMIDAGNIGRQMLQKLGWSEGMTLGHTNSGIAVPISMKIKNTKYGVGF
jgi:hypothetical protein